MEPAATYRMKGRVVLRRIGEDRLLVPVSGGVARENCVFPINETGEFIWNGLVAGKTLDQIAQAVAAEFSVPPGTALEDCGTLAAELAGHGLLERGPG